MLLILHYIFFCPWESISILTSFFGKKNMYEQFQWKSSFNCSVSCTQIDTITYTSHFICHLHIWYYNFMWFSCYDVAYLHFVFEVPAYAPLNFNYFDICIFTYTNTFFAHPSNTHPLQRELLKNVEICACSFVTFNVSFR